MAGSRVFFISPNFPTPLHSGRLALNAAEAFRYTATLKNISPFNLTRVNARDFFDVLHVSVSDPGGALQRIVLSLAHAQILYQGIRLAQLAQPAAIHQGLTVPEEPAAQPQNVQQVVNLLTGSAIQITTIRHQDYIRTLLKDIWQANLAGQPLHEINIIKIGQKYKSGNGIYFLAEKMVRNPGLGLIPDDIEIRAFHNELAKIINASRSNWNMKNLHYNAPRVPLTNLLILKGFLSKIPPAEVVRRYGSLRDMIKLAADNDDMHLGQLFSALGTHDKLRELLNIPPDVCLDDWKWKIIPLPAKTAFKVIQYVQKHIDASNPLPAIIRRLIESSESELKKLGLDKINKERLPEILKLFESNPELLEINP